MQDLTFVKSVSCEETLQAWVEREGNDPAWQASALDKGFDSVRSWRQTYLFQFGLQNFEWAEYQITDPISFIPNLYCGAYPSWQKYYSDRSQSQFKHIAPQLKDNSRVQAYIQQGLDHPFKLIALKHQNTFMLLEGHHTVCAFTLKPVFTQVTLYLCDLTDHTELFNQIFNDGIKSFTQSEWKDFLQNQAPYQPN